MSDVDLELVKTSVNRFAASAVSPARDALNHHPDEPLPDALLPGLRELGLFDIDDDPALLGAVLECLARVCAAPALVVLTNAFARAVLARLGRKNGSGPGAGALVGFPIYDEPFGGVAQLRLSDQGAEGVLDGECRTVALAPIADALVLPAQTASGVALIYLDKTTPGLRVGDSLLTLGMRGCPTADVSAQMVRIPQNRILARGDDARDLLVEVSLRFFPAVSALMAGIVESSLSTAAEYARDRYQGGQMIADHQQVRVMLGEMAADLGACRDASRTAAALVPATALASLRARDVALRATTDGAQLLGGNGYMEDYGQERCMRDARQAANLFGRTDYWRQLLVGRWLGAEAADGAAEEARS